MLLCRWDGDATGLTGDPRTGTPQRSALERLTSRLTALGVQVVPLADSTRVLSFFGGWGAQPIRWGRRAVPCWCESICRRPGWSSPPDAAR